MTEYIPITPDGIETDDTGRVLDLSLRIWVDKSRYLVPLHIYKDRGVLTLEGWYPLARCYIKVEKQEPRKPLEVWIEVHSDFGLAMRPIAFTSEAEAKCSSHDGMMRLFREVTPPEVKELPDSKGVWCLRGGNLIVEVEGHNEPSLVYWCGRDQVFKIVDNLPIGDWIRIDRIVDQAFRDGIKIEKPDFGGSDE